ncbi:hypothetical protein MAR_007770 [Mya arenaria]|uniref:Uncharacterized protein n=1 Tax=Mya arenaria TaxID=6604 RepID=A0ABY7DX71_MYAAR|nr:hypothetical protein MAR_007770 [Mya arenaria]
MAAPRRLRMALLEHELAQVRFQYNLVLAAILEAAERERQRARRRERRWWVRELILRRPLFGQYETLMKELEAEHAVDFKAFLRMEPQMYYELLNRVGPHITKSTTPTLIVTWHGTSDSSITGVPGHVVWLKCVRYTCQSLQTSSNNPGNETVDSY